MPKNADPRTSPPCPWPDCGEPTKIAGLCSRDYSRVRAMGMLDTWRSATAEDLPDLAGRAAGLWTARDPLAEAFLPAGASPELAAFAVELEKVVDADFERRGTSALPSAELDAVAVELQIHKRDTIAEVLEGVGLVAQELRELRARVHHYEDRLQAAGVFAEPAGMDHLVEVFRQTRETADRLHVESRLVRERLAVSADADTDTVIEIIGGDLEDTRREGIGTVVRQLSEILGDPQAALASAAQLDAYLERVRAAVIRGSIAFSPEDLRARVRLLDEADALDRRVEHLRATALGGVVVVGVANG